MPPGTQAAARLLWTALGSGKPYGPSEEGKGHSSFSCFLSSFGSLLPDLELHHVFEFMHRAAGLPGSQPSMLVFVWDEVSIGIQKGPGELDTFLQRQLTHAVGSRITAWRQAISGGLNILPVIVASSASSWTTSLAQLSGWTPYVRDLLLPCPAGLEDKQLIVMDLLRRLPGRFFRGFRQRAG